MNLKPGQFDRALLLLAILYSMAIIVPSACISRYGWDSVFPAQSFLAVFMALLILTLVMAGTKRKIIIAIAAFASMGVVWGVSTLYDFEGLGKVTYYQPKPDPLRLIDNGISALGINVAVSALVMFVLSFALSFVFDKVIGPVVEDVADDELSLIHI